MPKGTVKWFSAKRPACDRLKSAVLVRSLGLVMDGSLGGSKSRTRKAFAPISRCRSAVVVPPQFWAEIDRRELPRLP
jgi:hypothetical protein